VLPKSPNNKADWSNRVPEPINSRMAPKIINTIEKPSPIINLNSPITDSIPLLTWVLKKNHAWLITNKDYTLTTKETNTLKALIEQRQPRVMAIMPLPVPKSSNLHDLSLNKSNAMSIKSSVSGRGISVSATAYRS
jgi:hypothetical protein